MPRRVRRGSWRRWGLSRLLCLNGSQFFVSECNREWLLKNSNSRSSQKFRRTRMPYKRRSRFWWTFSILRLGQFFGKRGFFNSHGIYHQQRLLVFAPSIPGITQLRYARARSNNPPCKNAIPGKSVNISPKYAGETAMLNKTRGI